ncbi:hypothetical protein OU415_14190 [Saccharopolyspora sp. WRP15-2]|uniref:FXSXX-COOH protein n=1 Tax=Saccharopolyspora oryzae TaxID=2997343 RepID=A0ABT4UY14_9PSEU|nr:hypothetical protein [Saccharopolyspora oryzae]MDA3626593.1 hypothetical protein [Saccharopolyspora oryzae]
MTFSSLNAEPGISSELVDLGAISLPELRTLKDSTLHRSLRHVVQQTADIGVIPSPPGEGGERVD